MEEDAPEYTLWGPAAAKLLRTMRLEASRAGAEEATPSHLLLALVDQPELHQALRAIHQVPDVYAMRARAAGSSLGPVDYSDETPLSRLTESVLEDIRAPATSEPEQMLYLLAFKRILGIEACRKLLRAGGSDLEVLDQTFERVG